MDLINLGADHSLRLGQAGFVQTFSPMGTAVDVMDAPITQNAGEASIGIVVDHDDGGAAPVELLDCTEPDTLEPAHDDMAAPSSGSDRIHARMMAICCLLWVAGL
jgi:hypothetical protein